jgi:hypothetical protein
MDNFYINKSLLRETLYWFNRERWYTDKEVKSKWLQLPETKNNIRFTRDIILEHIAEQSTHVTVNTMKAVSEVAVELQKEQEEELLLTMATLE